MSYIGNSPGVASQRVTTTITATAGQTQFTTLSGYILGYVDVYLNGAKLINGVDFEAITGTYITLFTGAVVNDVVELVSYIPRGLTDGYTKAEADAKFLDVTGDTATGTLSIKNTTLSAQNDSVANWAYTSTLSSISNPIDIYFKPDGLKMFIAFASTITQYTLTTAWDTTTATAGTTFSMSAIDTGTAGLFFSPDGTKMVTCGTTGVVIANGSGVAAEDRAYYFTLSTAWDVTTATLVSSVRFAIGDAGGLPAALTVPQAVDFNNDGTIMYILDSTTDYVNQFALSTAYNVSTATYTKRFNIATEDSGGTALRFNSAGTRMYLLGTAGDHVNEYRLTTAWDIASAVYYDKFYIGWYETSPSGLFISESANAAFICGSSSDVIIKFATNKYKLQLSAETASGKIDLAGNTRVLNNFAVDGNSYFDGTIVTGSTLSIGSTFTGANITANQITTSTTAITLGGSVSTGATALTTTQSTGTITVGGTAATGAITLGQSTAAQTLNLGTGATATATTKTINIGTAGLSGSTTAIQIGSAVSGATNTTTINGGLVLANGALTFDGTALASSSSGTQSLTVTSTATAAYIQTTGANAVNARLQSNASTASVGTISNHSFIVQTNANNVATFTTAGDMGLGVTPTNYAGYNTLSIGPGASIGGIIQFQGTSGVDVAHIRADRSGSTAVSLTIETRSGSNAPIYIGTNAVTRMVIDTSGNILMGGVTVASMGTPKLFVTGSRATDGLINFQSTTNTSDVNHGVINIINSATGATGNDARIMFSFRQLGATTGFDPMASMGAVKEAGTNSAALQFNTRSATGYSEKMRLDSYGDLTVTGNIRTFTSPSAITLAANQYTDILYIGAGGYGALISGILTVYSTYSGAVTQNSYFCNAFGNGGGNGISMLTNGNYSTSATTVLYDRGNSVLGAGSRLISVYNASGNTIDIRFSFTPVGQYNSAGYYTSATNGGTAGVGTGVPSSDPVYFGQNYGVVKAANIIFPAARSASADLNTLDDYEEGTWTPAVGGTSSDPTVGYQFRSGQYTKIGRMVHVTFGIKINSISGGSGELRFTGLPFPILYRGAYQEPSNCLQGGNWATASIAGQTYMFGPGNSTTLGTRVQLNSDQAIDITNVGSQNYFGGTFVYEEA